MIQLCQKKGRESKCQFDFQPLNIKNRLEICACRWHATYRLNDLNERYNFVLDLTSIECLHKKLWAFKVAGVPILGISRLSTWESRKNDIWM
jgi:hypothetical protein